MSGQQAAPGNPGGSPYARLSNALADLGLGAMRDGIDGFAAAVNSGERTAVEALLELAQRELDFRRDKAVGVCTRTAHLPFPKGFADFDFSFQPSLNRDEVMDLQTLRFAERAENVLFIGSPGVGKTHLATAIGMEAARRRMATYFITCSDLMMKLKRAQGSDRLDIILDQYSRYGILIIDEVGFLPLDANSSNLFFQLVSRRYEKHSTVITTNKPLNRWGETFGDPVLASAILDRLLHHSRVFTIVGRSYRTKDFDLSKAGSGPLGGNGKETEQERKEAV